MNLALLLGEATVTSSSWMSWLTLPLFDWNAAWIVGAIVAVGAVLVIAAAIASPVVAIQGGATSFGTAFTVTIIGLITGTIAGTAAGMYWGREGDAKREQQVQYVTKVSNHIDIYFVADPKATGGTGQAKNLECVVVRYDAEGLESKQPGVKQKEIRIKAMDMETFNAEVEKQLSDWLGGRKSGSSLKVNLFLKPNPGNTVQHWLGTYCKNNGCVLTTIEAEYVSALDR